MSTAIAVSAFYDVDFSCSNRRNTISTTHSHHRPGSMTQPPTADSHHHQPKAVGAPITGANRNRNLLERSISEPVTDRNSNSQLSQQQNRTNVNSSRYKTELCRPFEENGYCKYGDKCQFAHGMHELRSLARHPKYKTELCRTFHTIGFCPYGPRCHFMHNDEERGNMVKQEQNPQPQQHQRQQQHPSQGRLSPPQHHASFPPLSLLPITRDSLGSVADSPTSSVTDSPVMSPTFVGDGSCDALSSSYNTCFGGGNPPMFNFHTDLAARNQSAVSTTTLMSPLNIHTDPIATLTADLQAVMLSSNQRNNLNLNLLNMQKPIGLFGLAGLMEDNLYAPPSPPDSLSGDSSSSSSSISTSSMCGSPLEVSRGLRLPIFTTLSHE